MANFEQKIRRQFYIFRNVYESGLGKDYPHWPALQCVQLTPPMGDDGRRDTSTPPGRPKTLRRGVLSSWIRFVRQYPLQALRRPYRRVPCRWRRDAAPGRTRHCPSLHLASQREDAPAPAAGPTSPYCRAHGWTRRQDYGKRRPAGPPQACQRQRRRNGGPGFGREPLRKKVNTQAFKLDRQKWLLQGEGAFNL